MKTKKKLIFLITGSIAVFCILIFIQIESKKEASIEFFSIALKEHSIFAEVNSKERVYVVDSGVVYKDEKIINDRESLYPLKIAYALTVAERSPIFSLPSNNLTIFNNAIIKLDEAKDELIKIQKNIENEEIISTSLYPIDFLKSLSILEESRRNFLARPNEETFKMYESRIDKTLSLYKDNLKKHTNAFNTTVPENASVYLAGETIVERVTITGLLKDMETGIKNTEEIFKRRHSCFYGNYSSCDTLDLKIPFISKKESLTTDNPTIESVMDVYSLIDQVFEKVDINTDQLVKLHSSYCVGSLPNPQIFAVTSEDNSNQKERIPFYLGDIRLTVTEKYPDIGYYRYFYEDGIDYLNAPLDAFYSCPELIIDYGDIFGTLLIYNLVKESPASSFLYGEQKETLLSLENRLTSGKIIKEEDALEYLYTALTFYSNTPKSTELESKQILKELINISLATRDKTAGLGYHIDHMATFQKVANGWNLRIEKEEISSNNLTPQFLFYVRSAFFSLFLAPHYSVLGAFDSPYFEHTQPMLLDNQPDLFYSEIKGLIDKNKIINDLRFYVDTEKLILEKK